MSEPQADHNAPVDPAPADPSPGGSRARLVFAGVATAVLVAVATAVAVSGGGDDGAAVPQECLTAWNSDSIAVSDGVHAYSEHGYRESLLTRIDDAGNVLDPEDAGAETGDARCALAFAAAQVDFEPDFGVRVQTQGGWLSLAQSDGTPLEQIARIQADAVATANVTLLPDGRLAAD